MLNTIYAGITALVVITGPSLAYAQNPRAEAASQRITAADLNALTDARIAIVKGTLQLTADQEKYWPAIEEAIRARAKARLARLEPITTGAAGRADGSAIEVLRDRNPVEFWIDAPMPWLNDRPISKSWPLRGSHFIRLSCRTRSVGWAS